MTPDAATRGVATGGIARGGLALPRDALSAWSCLHGFAAIRTAETAAAREIVAPVMEGTGAHVLARIRAALRPWAQAPCADAGAAALASAIDALPFAARGA